MKICCKTLDLTGNHAYNILITAKTEIYFANDQVTYGQYNRSESSKTQAVCKAVK